MWRIVDCFISLACFPACIALRPADGASIVAVHRLIIADARSFSPIAVGCAQRDSVTLVMCRTWEEARIVLYGNHARREERDSQLKCRRCRARYFERTRMGLRTYGRSTVLEASHVSFVQTMSMELCCIRSFVYAILCPSRDPR